MWYQGKEFLARCYSEDGSVIRIIIFFIVTLTGVVFDDRHKNDSDLTARNRLLNNNGD